MVDYKKLSTDEETLMDVPLVTEAKKSRKGCSARKICLIIFLSLVGITVLTAGFMYMFVRTVVIRSSVTTPVNLPIIEISDAELDLVEDRANYFVDQIRVGLEPTEDLVVTQREINGFISHSDYLRGNAYVELHNGHVTTNWSLPLYPFPGGKGRYFVANDDVALHSEDEEVSVEIDVPEEVKKAPKDLPLSVAVFKYVLHDDTKRVSAFLHGLKMLGEDKGQDYIAKHEDILLDLYEDPEAALVLEHIESVSIKDGSIVFTPRRNSSASKTGDLADAWDAAENVAVEKALYLRKPKPAPEGMKP